MIREKPSGLKIVKIEMIVVDGAATETRASAAASAAQAATGASRVELTEVVVEAPREIGAQIVENRELTDLILTSQDPRRASNG